tara:strand:+ start:466 stop:1668 length:1203 start_codon:yes stop_codon:yes gene_type:complete
MRKQWTKEELISFEDGIVELYKDCKLPFLFHVSGGNEEQLIEIFKDIKEGDYVLSNHRGHYHALLHGIPPETVKDRIINGRSMFIFDRERNYFTSAIIGGTPAIAAGIALALKNKGSDKKVWCFVGDGTEDSGHLYEAIRYVDGWDLPCKFVIEGNDRSVFASNSDRWGKAGDYKWDSPSVIKYHYDITYPHCRTPDMIDLKKTSKKTDEEYFPPVPQETFPDLSHIDPGDLSYKDAVTKAMTELGDSGSYFIGYNVRYGDAMGNLKNVDDNRKIETPVAENLMSGLGIGMSFEGIKPVVFYERHDFMLVAADAIGNHMNHIYRISHKEFNVPVILRTVVADAGPFYSGPTHSQDFTSTFREMVDFPVYEPETPEEVLVAYEKAKLAKGPVMIVERKSCL